MGDEGQMSHLLGSVSGFMPFDGTVQNSDPHSSLPCTSSQYCCGDSDIFSQSFNTRFMTSCTTNEPEAHIHQKRASPATSQPVRYPESSQRTTSAFPSPAQYSRNNPDFFTSSTILSPPIAPLACHIPPGSRGWISSQDVEQGLPPVRLDIEPLNYPDRQSPSRQSQVSSDSASTEYTFTDDSDIETGAVMAKMMANFQVPTPPLDADTSMWVAEQELSTLSSTPSILTFRLGRRSLRPVTDPDSARILENFDDTDEGKSEGSCESISPSLPPFYSPSSFYDVREARSCGNIGRTVTGGASPNERCSSYTPDESPSFHGRDIHSVAPRNAKPRTNGSSKKSKMHECEICHKNFPRPSGLNTHMNSHSGAKPFKCPVSSCDKRFAVRSNAKRHLKTHGINPSLIEGPSQGSNFTVGFEEPLVNHHVHDVGRPPTRLRWIPHSPATRTQPVAGCIGSTSSAGDDSEGTYPILSALLPAAAPSSSNPALVYHYGIKASGAGSRHYHTGQVSARGGSEE